MSQADRRSAPVAAVVFLVLIVALSIAVYLKWQRANVELTTVIDQNVMRVVPQPIPLPEATLTRMDGKPFERKNFLGKWTFLYFGYTLCPDVCPTELTALAEVAALLRKEGVGASWQEVFVSVDPERDTPEQLAKFVSYFDPKIIGATGDPAELATLAKPLGVGWEKAALPTANDAKSTSYLINHTTSILLISPEASLVGVFSTPHDPVAMVKAFRTVIGE